MKKEINLKLCMSSKAWVMVMALTNLGLGISIIIGGSIWMAENSVSDTFKTYFACGIGVGVLNIVAGCILISALVQGKERTVLLYIVLELIVLFILTIFSTINIYEEFSLVLLGLFCSCPLLWIGLYNVYGFYVELNNYNNSAVQSGLDEIACNTQSNPLATFPEKAFDTTTV